MGKWASWIEREEGSVEKLRPRRMGQPGVVVGSLRWRVWSGGEW